MRQVILGNLFFGEGVYTPLMMQNFFKNADDLLYKAKQNVRNRIEYSC